MVISSVEVQTIHKKVEENIKKVVNPKTANLQNPIPLRFHRRQRNFAGLNLYVRLE
jgi:hypothetical protein